MADSASIRTRRSRISARLTRRSRDSSSAIGPFRMELKSASSLFDVLAEAIVYQQLHGRAAASIYARVRALMPRTRGLAAARALSRCIGRRVARRGTLAIETAGAARSRAKTIDGHVPTLAQARRMEDEAIIEHLTEIRGIGRWTAQMLLMFRLGRPDVLPVGDYGIRKGFRDRVPQARDADARGRRAARRTLAAVSARSHRGISGAPRNRRRSDAAQTTRSQPEIAPAFRANELQRSSRSAGVSRAGVSRKRIEAFESISSRCCAPRPLPRVPRRLRSRSTPSADSRPSALPSRASRPRRTRPATRSIISPRRAHSNRTPPALLIASSIGRGRSSVSGKRLDRRGDARCDPAARSCRSTSRSKPGFHAVDARAPAQMLAQRTCRARLCEIASQSR